jgi:hypothetical protein
VRDEEVPGKYQQILLKLSEKEDMKRLLFLNYPIRKRNQLKPKSGQIIRWNVDIYQNL